MTELARLQKQTNKKIRQAEQKHPYIQLYPALYKEYPAQETNMPTTMAE